MTSTAKASTVGLIVRTIPSEDTVMIHKNHSHNINARGHETKFKCVHRGYNKIDHDKACTTRSHADTLVSNWLYGILYYISYTLEYNCHDH